MGLFLFSCVFAVASQDVSRLRAAGEANGPARDIDPEALVDMLSEAVKRDAPETVLRLLEGVDAKEFGFSAMHEAAGRDSVRVAQALLDAGYDADLGVDKPLHLAAKHESPRVAALLLEHGAEVSPRDEVGWTPLHYALLEGTARPGLRTANLLLEHGADVNAATAAVGWTPLHLAAHLSGAVVSPKRDEPSGWNVSPRGHGPDVVDIVRKLIERGAAVGARTRVGGWTPARVAKASDEHRRYGLEAGAASKAVLAAIEGAGGEDEGCDDSPRLPAYRGGRTSQDRERQEAAAASGCEHNLPFAVPGVVFAGGHSVAGSFTAPGADEALLFVGYGIVDGGSWLHLLSLRDRQGVVRPIKAFDHHTDYEGLCLDRETNTHAAVFTRSYDGTCCPEVDTAYYQYDADVGNLVEVFVDVAEQPTGENAECQWRDTAAGAQADDDDDHDPAVEEWLEAFGEVAADTGIRAALDADISFFAETSEQLAAFFRDATVESLTPFLGSEQLLQQAARYADDPSIVTFLIASGFDPNKAFGPTIPAENQHDRRSGEQRAGPLHDAARYNANPSIVAALAKGGADLQATGGWDMYTPLHYAVRHNSAAVVSALLRNGAQPNEVAGPIDPAWSMSPDINGNAALHVAVCKRPGWSLLVSSNTSPAAGLGDSAVIDALVAAGANVQQANSSGATPLHLAVMCGKAASVSALLRHGADANAVVTLANGATEMHDCTGCNPIHLLVDSFRRYDPGSPARRLLSLLLDAGADINAKVSQHMYKGYSALGLAVAAEKGPEAVALLLESGAQVDPGSLRAVFEERFQYSGSHAGGFDFREEGSEDNLRVLGLLIRNGADLDAADSCQRTALHLAANIAVATRMAMLADGEDPGVVRAVEMLVSAGADVDARTVEANTVLGSDGVRYSCPYSGATPLHVAASRGATSVASALLDFRADLIAKDAAGRTPLDVAAELGHVDVLNLFLRDAARYEWPELVMLLIERGAEVDARDDIGWAPLHYALLGGTDRPGFRTANVLLEHGADVNAATAAVGWTPLHLAAHLDGADVLEVVQGLIERGADVGARTRVGGWSPVRLAKARGEYLRSEVSAEAVLAAIQAAGGKDEGCDDMPQLPVYLDGSEIASWEDMVRWPRTVVPPACEYNLPFPDVLPTIIDADGRSVAGSFTAPGADEALRFVKFGRLDFHFGLDLVSLRHESGAILPIMAFDRRLDYKGLCLDDETNTHAAVFRRSYSGSCCPEVDTMYYQYDADAGNLVEVFVDHNAVAPPTGVDTACRWRAEKEARMRSGQ